MPRGVGLNQSVNLHFENGKVFTITYDYIGPSIFSYNITSYDDFPWFLLWGVGFDFLAENNVTINNQLFNFTKSIGGNNLDNAVGFEMNRFPNFTSGTQLNITINVANQISDQVTFYYFPQSINITEKKFILSYSGGSFEINGAFITNDASLVFVTINGTQCSISSYTNTRFTITYPPKNVGFDYVLILTVGGYRAESAVDFINGLTPTQTSTPTPTQTSTPNSTPKPSDDSKISISSNLKILVVVDDPLSPLNELNAIYELDVDQNNPNLNK
ncbi:hypothetical protein ACTFIZ_001928 [Dictyostelium cf. discoideum]